MAYGFNVAQYLPGPEGLSGWNTLNAAIARVRQRRHAKEMQEREIAATAERDRLQRTFSAAQAQVAETNLRQRNAMEQEREAAARAAAAAGQALLAEQEGRPGAADAIVAGAAPTGLTARYANRPEAPAAPETALREPQLRTERAPAVAPQQALTQQLREPMTGPPGTGTPLWDAIQRERAQLSVGDQGRQIGALGQDINAGLERTRPAPDAPPDVREFRRGDKVLATVDRGAEARRRALEARLQTAPGALSSNALAAGAAGRAQEAAGAAAEHMPVDEAVDKALGTRKDELGLIGKDRAAELRELGLRLGHERGQSVDDRTLWSSYERELSKYATPAVKATKDLEQLYTRFRSATPDQKRALARPMAVALTRAAGDVGALSNQDVSSNLDTQYRSYWETIKSWVESRGEGELPELVIQNLDGVAQGLVEASRATLQQYGEQLRQGVSEQPWETPLWRERTLKRVDGVFGRLRPQGRRREAPAAPSGDEIDAPAPGYEELSDEELLLEADSETNPNG